MKMTSALACKLIAQLKSEKETYLARERDSSTYTVAAGEEPYIPTFDFESNNALIAAIDEKVMSIKHALNLSNATSSIKVGDKTYSVDQILVRMAQLSARLKVYDTFRQRLPKERSSLTVRYGTRRDAVEFTYTNYDITKAQAAFEETEREIIALQLALDKHNQTFEFEVDY